MRIYLLGFMGCGKSYMGRHLAKRLGFGFIDMDDYIEAREGQSISEIFSIQGESRFRELERKYLKETGQLHQFIIATGGGTPCFHRNMDWINAHGLSVFLNTAIPLIFERLVRKRAHRPLVAAKSDEELMEYIHRKLQERLVYYNQAHLVYHRYSAEEDALGNLFRALSYRIQ